MNTWLNIIGYQCVWLAAVWGASRGLWWPAAMAMLPFAGWMLSRDSGRIDLMLMACVVPIGAAMDSLMAATGLLAYAAPVPSTQLAPLWIVAIWMCFALTLRHSFRFLFGKPVLAALFGAVGAPMAYLAAGRGWKAVHFVHGPVPALAALAVLWALALPAMMFLARRLEQRSPDPVPGGQHA